MPVPEQKVVSVQDWKTAAWLVPEGAKRDVFVSHRCDEYHGSIIEKLIEMLLKNNNLSHWYGCFHRPENVIGDFNQNVERAAELSACYLAIVQPSWHIQSGMNLVLAKWPPHEFELWKKYHPTSKLCFGILIDGARRPVFLDTIPCYPVTTKQIPGHNASIFYGSIDKLALWGTDENLSRISKALELFRPPEVGGPHKE